MRYKIKNDSTQITFEESDRQREPISKQDEFGGEKVICSEGKCYSVSSRPIEPDKDLK
jgi:hypothetical protein